jgi:hypothetical protein
LAFESAGGTQEELTQNPGGTQDEGTPFPSGKSLVDAMLEISPME